VPLGVPGAKSAQLIKLSTAEGGPGLTGAAFGCHPAVGRQR
jgi:hypothetical protein